MTITDVERSLFKALYDTFEVPLNVKIFDSVYYVNFDDFTHWVVLDSLSNSTGALPRANFNLHISVKKALRNEKNELTRLCDKVCAVFNEGARFDVYSDTTASKIGEMEVCASSLLPIMRHGGGGSFRTLTIGIVYAGEVIDS